MKILKVLSIVALVLSSSATHSQIKLPRLISDGMVLQRDTPLKIWGWASPGESITLTLNSKDYKTTASSEGDWQINLPAQKAGGPFELKLSGKNNITLKNILFGDVWICSGQSNMELDMQRASDYYPNVIASSENNFIRQFQVPDHYNFNEPQKDYTDGNWIAVNPKTILKFTAVGYFFAKKLHDEFNIPIGLINAALGGSPAEAWMSEDALKEFPHYIEKANYYKSQDAIDKTESADRERAVAWDKKLNEEDLGNQASPRWMSEQTDDSSWNTIQVPGQWREQEIGNINGSVWFRKKITLTKEQAERNGRLWLGRIVDSDSVWVNGTFVGTTGYEWPPRKYNVSGNILKAGKNTITVRVISSSSHGGFVEDKPYFLALGADTINVSGEWKYKVGTRIEPGRGQTFIRWQPVGLYNAMIAPLIGYAFKGVIWYQGESNANRAKEYNTLFPAMINNWRDILNQGEFPFLFVQLANFMESKEQPSESGWAELREAQLNTLSRVKNTAMAVTIDIGDWNDIHPLNKKDVGERLALAAFHHAYKKDKIVYSGPLYKSMKVIGNKIEITFSHTGSGLVAKGGTLHEFAIAGTDKKFVWAKAIIQNNKVIVWSDQVEKPVAVRYAWADNPDKANLYNKEGLPASPFRTDQ